MRRDGKRVESAPLVEAGGPTEKDTMPCWSVLVEVGDARVGGCWTKRFQDGVSCLLLVIVQGEHMKSA